ncbi:uncharacterized protein LOC131143463 isoform X4 [Malania oleifera]|uniref:uncharacterized protein LOC131143463 isoform X4 n=1 Tax=Malania oleifera TaxID=397392 RepID=UPI0025ADDA77|nr:uncharacterized protein LOC131143463 isoform X4 [Malania oleifera]XP_057947758.1 uncharacterized protein LOC131143463 isoform X4 [Malania oleifera]
MWFLASLIHQLSNSPCLLLRRRSQTMGRLLLVTNSKELGQVTKPRDVRSKGKSMVSSQSYYQDSKIDSSSTNTELLHLLREQGSWKQSQGLSLGNVDYPYFLPGRKQPFSALEDPFYPDPRGYPHGRLESLFPVASARFTV